MKKMQTQLRLTTAMVALCASAACAQNSWNMDISFAGYAGRAETLTNFPARVTFTDGVGAFSFASHPFATDTGYDLRFYDDTNALLDYEIDTFIPGEVAHVWVKVPELKPDGSTSIRAVWGNREDAAQLDCTTNGAVWAGGFLLVQHYTDSLTDATPAKRAASFVNASGYADGVIGNAVNLTQTARNSGVRLSAALAIGSEWTVSAWFKNLQPTGAWRTLTRGASNHHIIVQDSSNRLGAYIGGFRWADPAEIAPDEGVWRQITVVGITNTTAFYLDGEPIGTIGGYQSTDTIIGIGYNHNDSSQKFADYLDETRITGRMRSADWIWAAHKSESGDAAFTVYAAPVAKGPPRIENAEATHVVPGEAVFNAMLFANGEDAATVAVLWGTTDESETGAWTHTDAIADGPWANGTPVSFHATGLTADQEYFYTFVAENTVGATVAPDVSYVINAPLAFTVDDAVFGSTVSDTAQITVTRPASCVGAPLTVYYSLSGTAKSGVNYAATPASGELVIPAGETEATLTISPLTPLNFDAAKNVVVTLEPGAYIVGATGNEAEVAQAVIPVGTYFWNAASGNWSDEANWSPAGGPPLNGGDIARIESGIATADRNLGSAGNWPQISVVTGGTLSVASSLQGTLGNPFFFDGGTIGSTSGKTLAGDITLGDGGMTMGPAQSYALSGAISGTGGIAAMIGYGYTATLGGGRTDTSPNTYEGLTEIRSGTVTLSKSNNTIVLPGDVLLDGGNMQVYGLYRLIDTNINMTIRNGQFAVGGNGTQQSAYETVSNLFLFGESARVDVGAGSYGGSSVTVQDSTIVSNGLINATGKAAWFVTHSLDILLYAGRTNITVGTTDNNGDAGLRVGAGGLTVRQPDEGLSWLLRLSCGTPSRNTNFDLQGNLLYEGNPLNTNATLTAISGTYTNQCLWSLGNAKTITVNPGGGLIDLVFAPRIYTTSTGRSVTKEGQGSLVLTHFNNDYIGPTFVNAGALLVDGALVNAGNAVTAYASLGGNGSIAGAVTVSGGTLAPGAFAPGQLTLGNNLTMTDNATLHIELGGTEAGIDYDQLVLTKTDGIFTIENAGIDVTLLDGFRPEEGAVFAIVDNQSELPIDGAFSGLESGKNVRVGTWLFSVNTRAGDGNDVTLTAHRTRSVILVR